MKEVCSRGVLRFFDLDAETTIQTDASLKGLGTKLLQGWPVTREQCPQLLYDYWNFREELTIDYGHILNQEGIVMPQNLRELVITTIHEGHLGQEKCPCGQDLRCFGLELRII